MTQITLHANCVALNDRGVLIIGKSGSGKSALSLELMAFGAHLVSDDQTVLKLSNGGLSALAPAPISGLIEARGFGILKANPCQEAIIGLVVDLDKEASERLPPAQCISYLGCQVPLRFGGNCSSLGPAILQFLRAGFSSP